jgi:hypothetical protein
MGRGVRGRFQPPVGCTFSCFMIVSGPAMTSSLGLVFGDICYEIVGRRPGSCRSSRRGTKSCPNHGTRSTLLDIVAGSNGIVS